MIEKVGTIHFVKVFVLNMMSAQFYCIGKLYMDFCFTYKLNTTIPIQQILATRPFRSLHFIVETKYTNIGEERSPRFELFSFFHLSRPSSQVKGTNSTSFLV